MKKYGANSIEVSQPYVEYQKNKYKKNINGFIFDEININPIIQQNNNFVISKAISEYKSIGIIINKSNTKILNNINEIIRDIHYNGNIYKSYKNIIDNSNILC